MDDRGGVLLAVYSLIPFPSHTYTHSRSVTHTHTHTHSHSYRKIAGDVCVGGDEQSYAGVNRSCCKNAVTVGPSGSATGSDNTPTGSGSPGKFPLREGSDYCSPHSGNKYPSCGWSLKHFSADRLASGNIERLRARVDFTPDFGILLRETHQGYCYRY